MSAPQGGLGILGVGLGSPCPSGSGVRWGMGWLWNAVESLCLGLGRGVGSSTLFPWAQSPLWGGLRSPCTPIPVPIWVSSSRPFSVGQTRIPLPPIPNVTGRSPLVTSGVDWGPYAPCSYGVSAPLSATYCLQCLLPRCCMRRVRCPSSLHPKCWALGPITRRWCGMLVCSLAFSQLAWAPRQRQQVVRHQPWT